MSEHDELAEAIVAAMRESSKGSDNWLKLAVGMLTFIVAAIFWAGYNLAEIQTRQSINTGRIADNSTELARMADTVRNAVDKLDARVRSLEGDVARMNGRDEARRSRDGG